MFFSTAVVVFLAAVGGAFLLRGIIVSFLLIVYIHFEEFEIYDTIAQSGSYTVV